MVKDVKKKTLPTLFFSSLGFSLSLLIFVNLVNAIPGTWYGTVKISGLTAPAGTNVTVYLNGVEAVSTTVLSSPAGYYLITVNGNVGDNVGFKINGIDANEGNQTFTFAATFGISLDISATQLADTTPPTRSNGLPTGNITTTSTTLRLTTDELATCKYGTTANTAYSSIASTFSTTGSTSHSQSLTGLSNGNYNYYVRCIDAAGNNNTDDSTIAFTVNVSASDATAPYISNPQPRNRTVLLYNTTAIAVNITTDENARCRYNTTAGIIFANMSSANQTSLSTLHTWNFSLTTGTTYSLYFKCNDTSSNNNTNDFYLTFSTGTLATNTSFNVTANQTATLDVKNTVNVTLDIVTNTSLNNTVINVTTSTKNMTSTNVTGNEFKYVQIDTSANLNSSVFTSIMVKIYYTDEELTAAGITDENTLAMFWFNETSGSWTRLNSTSMNWVYATGVNTVNNYIWANVSHLSSFAGVGLKANGDSCTASTDCYSNYCRSEYQAYSSNKYCAQNSSTCVHATTTLAQQYANGYTTCYGSYKEECSSGSWSETYCTYGCSNGVCGSAPTAAAAPSAEEPSAAAPPSVQIKVTTQRGKATITVPSIAAGKMASVTINKTEDMTVNRIEITVKNSVNNIQVVVTKLSDKPASITQSVTGKVYHYIEITKTNITDADVNKSKVNFKVEKAWITANNINESTIALQRYADNKWNKLTTTKVSEDTTDIYFEAESPGLSVFAISGEEKVSVACPTCPQPSSWSECVAGKQTRTNYKCSKETNYQCQSYTQEQACEVVVPPIKVPEIPTIWIVIILVVIVFLIFLQFKKREGKKVKQKKR